MTKFMLKLRQNRPRLSSGIIGSWVIFGRWWAMGQIEMTGNVSKKDIKTIY